MHDFSRFSCLWSGAKTLLFNAVGVKRTFIFNFTRANVIHREHYSSEKSLISWKNYLISSISARKHWKKKIIFVSRRIKFILEITKIIIIFFNVVGRNRWDAIIFCVKTSNCLSTQKKSKALPQTFQPYKNKRTLKNLPSLTTQFLMKMFFFYVPAFVSTRKKISRRFFCFPYHQKIIPASQAEKN